MKKSEIKKIIKLFSDKSMCRTQYNNCPCNTCFHSLDLDFKHICWLLVLSLRGDYKFEEIYESLEKEILKK